MTGLITKSRVASAAALAALVLFPALVSYPQTVSDIPSLSREVRIGSVSEKRDALYRLRVLGTEAASRAAIPALSDPDPIVRATAAGSIGSLPASEAAQVLIPLLSDKDEFVRQEALSAIGKAGAVSTEADVIHLVENEKDDAVRTSAVRAIGTIGTLAAVPALTRIFSAKPKDKNRFLRASAARAIGSIAGRMQDGKIPSTTPDSFLPMKDKPLIGRSSDLSIDRPEFEQAVSALRRVLSGNREAEESKREAAYALGEIGAREAAPDLKRCSSAQDPYLAESCREAVARLH